MNARTRQARRTIRERSAQTRFERSLRRGRSLATHALSAGIDIDTAKSMAAALNKVAQRLGMTPVKVDRTRNTVNSRNGRLRKVNHFASSQVRPLLKAYKPRKAEFVAAKAAMTHKLALTA